MSRTPSVTSVSSWLSDSKPKNGLTSIEILDRYENEFGDPNQILVGDSMHIVSNIEKIQIYNFICRNKDSNIYDALSWAINLYRKTKASNISIPDAAEEGFKMVVKRRRKNNSSSSKIANNESSQDNSDVESENEINEPDTREVKKPKQIMVSGIVNIIEFTKNLSRSGEFKFEAKIAGSCLKIFHKDLRNKMRIIEHLKQSKIEFYIIPDREIPIKAVIRGFPTSTSTEILNPFGTMGAYTHPQKVLKTLEFDTRKKEK